MELQRGQRGCRLVLVAYPSQGHLNPMLQLATILYSKGFSITIIHPQLNSPNPSNHTNFTFLSIPGTDEGLLSGPGNFAARLSAINKNCEAPLQQCMEVLMKEAGPHDRVACIIYDGFMYFTQKVCDHFKLPGINVWTSSADSLLTMADLAQGKQIDGFSEPRAAMMDATKTSSAVILNTMAFLEQTTLVKLKEYFPVPKIFSIGSFHKYGPNSSTSILLKEDTGCITWLDKQAPKSVIYVSFGSLTIIDEVMFLEVAWGLANSKKPFLWVVRPGSVSGSEWIEVLPKEFEETVRERGCIVKWAPQKEVLSHNAVGGFWSHCGWNSTLESICEGVPMLCRPFFADQMANAQFSSRVWRIGLELEKLESEEIEKVVRRLMVEEGEEMRKRAVELKVKAEICLQSGGSSYSFLNELVELLLSF